MAQSRRGSWWSKGLMLRVKGDRLKARINERSRYSQTPTLVGRLVPAADGTHVVGTIRWTQQLFNLALWPTGAVACAVAGIALLRDGDVLDALLIGLFAVLFAGLSVLFVSIFRSERESETKRLAEEIRRTFAQRR
jgi:hypothetical protein